jgi:hypothetical protein
MPAMDTINRFFLGWFLAAMGLNALAAGVFFVN